MPTASERSVRPVGISKAWRKGSPWRRGGELLRAHGGQAWVGQGPDSEETEAWLQVVKSVCTRPYCPAELTFYEARVGTWRVRSEPASGMQRHREQLPRHRTQPGNPSPPLLCTGLG